MKNIKVSIEIDREAGTLSTLSDFAIDGDRPTHSLHYIRCIKGKILRMGFGSKPFTELKMGATQTIEIGIFTT